MPMRSGLFDMLPRADPTTDFEQSKRGARVTLGLVFERAGVLLFLFRRAQEFLLAFLV